MAKAIALYEGGIHARIQIAVRHDGAVFKRYQGNDPRYGWKWERWARIGEQVDPDNLPREIEGKTQHCGLGDNGHKHVRLPA